MNEPQEQRNGSRRTPRWTTAFLRALERTGEAHAAAKDAGVDKSTAYARRRAHADFAAAWAEALRSHRARAKAEEEAEIARLKSGGTKITPPSAPSHRGKGKRRPEDVAVGGQVKRVSGERWGKRKEALFFDELAATNNIHRAAEAAGVSYNAVHRRRLRHPLFAAKWDAVSSSSRATIDMHLLEETRKAFDPATLKLRKAKPRVTIDQAIKISQIGATKAKGAGDADPFKEQAANMSAEDIEELRQRLLGKLRRLRKRKIEEQGFTLDEETGHLIPPGWVRAKPGPGEEKGTAE